MDKEKAKEYFDYLERKYTEWYTSKPKQRSAIQSEIYGTALRWDDEIYLYLNDNRATGLFEHGFFVSDIEKAFRLLKEIMDNTPGSAAFPEEPSEIKLVSVQKCSDTIREKDSTFTFPRIANSLVR